MRWDVWTTGAVLVVVACLQAFAQEPGRQVFRGRVDLVTILAFVVDDDGRPVRGLTPDDFVVRIDGQQRPVRALDYREFLNARPGEAAGSAGGRTILVLFDDLSYSSNAADLASIRGALQDAVRRLSALDRAGIVTTSGRAPAVAPSTDHVGVGQAARDLRGRITPPAAAGVFVSLIEALEIQRSGIRGSAAARVLNRECRMQNVPNVQVCTSLVDGQARLVLSEWRDRTMRQVQALRRALASLAAEPGPRLLVLISDGLATSDTVGFAGDLTALARAAAEANVQLFSIVGDRDSAILHESNRERVGARLADADLLQQGLLGLTTAIGGGALRLVGTANRPFDRVLLESSGAYQLGVEPPPGFSASIAEVTVSLERPGITVRANRLAVIPASTAALPPTDVAVRRVLEHGEVALGVPLTVAASSRRAAGGEDLEIAVDVVVPHSVATPVEIAFAIVDASGRTVKTATGTMPDDRQPGDRHFTFALALPAGEYRLRVAANDPDGRVGGIEHAVSLDLDRLGPFLVSDLQTGWIDAWGTRRFLAIRQLPATATAADVRLELYTGDGSTPRPGAVAIRLDVTPLGASSPLSSTTLAPAPMGDRWQLEASVPLDGLPAGEFTVDAVVLVDGSPVGSRSATLEKTGAAETALPARAALPSRDAVLAILAAELEAVAAGFDAAPFLAVPLVSAQVRSFAASAGESTPPTLAAEVVSTDDAFWELMTRTARESRTALGAFARGLLNLRLPNGPAAAAQLELALQRAPESTAARLYLGAAHALNGRDREAVDVWLPALAEPEIEPVWRLAAADALIRAGDRAAAIGMLRVVPAPMGESSAVRRRLVHALLMEGGTDEARPLVASLLERDPNDEDSRWLEIVMAFADAVVPGQDDAVQAFTAVANRYLARGGPRAEIVRAWLAAIS